MKQHIDTAPIWAAYRAPSECPLCVLEQESERGYVETFLGGSVMEPAVRMEVNEKGFCGAHFRMLYEAGNRLGLALMAHTHLKETIKKLEQRPVKRARLLGRAPDAPPSHASGCILCDRLNNLMARYEDTLLVMWAQEPAFREAFESSNGLCVRHFEHLADRASSELSGRDAQAFLSKLTQITLENLRRVEQDLEWFTLKFDYRNQDKPWGNSRDAVERTLNKLRSHTIATKEEDAP